MSATHPEWVTASAATERWHALEGSDAVARLDSDAPAGLASEEAAARLLHVGPNALREAKRRSPWAVFAGQLKSPLIYLLFVAAGIALVLGHGSDAVVIFVVVAINSVIGALQEGRAERSLESLRKLATHKVRVVRGGREQLVEARAVVPGDIMLLDAGDAVAADARLLEAANLQIAEAALTGESLPVAKDLGALAAETPLADRSNMVYAGTYVAAGRGRSVVVTTGLRTELGAIAQLAESAKELATPLERRIARFGRIIIYVSLGMFAIINGIGLLRGLPMGEILMLGISQLVGMIPEGLPVAMTIALAVGVQRMARRNTVVRRLSAVETLGSTTVICSDKTGTLTRNEMTATVVHLASGRELTVTGVGYAPFGDILDGARKVEPQSDPELTSLLEACALCSDAELEVSGREDKTYRPIGDTTEVALLTLAIKGGITPAELRARAPRRAELPFDSTAQMMATQHDGARGLRVFIKGAPEVVLALCGARRREGADEPLSEQMRQELALAARGLAQRALRVLAVASVDGVEIDLEAGFSAFSGRAVCLGLIGQIDPPRAEVRDAVAQCRAAGIRAVMVTGDHKATGVAIAQQLGIARPADLALDGRELESLSDAALADRIDRVAVFARVQPAQKLRIVDAYQQRGEVVAMTGDGVNDAPALVKANVGVAMGITGTEVAKQAAKVIIADDNFATLVAAVEEGRVVYRNIKKTVLLLFSTSLAEVLVLTLALLLGYPPPFAAVQILWNNLVTEGLITVNLVMEPPEGDEMSRVPIAPDEPLLTRPMIARLLLMAATITCVTLGWFGYRTAAGLPQAQIQTETFTLLAICEWFNVLNCRSERKSALTLGLLRNRWLLGGIVLGNVLQLAVLFWGPLARVFHTVPISLREILVLAGAGSLVLWVEELRKLVARQRASHVAFG